ncbi:MAG: NAD/NADP octopine/nopaline dehydrogenase family protein [Actinobacteria bacterium]|nr:NAD/NADP octopine/nopaline dehydrogenase family protein [Actinomycetota bacterium]
MNDNRIAVLGGGGIGLATATDLSNRGYKVNLFELPKFKENILPIKKIGGINFSGVMGSGFAKINIITTNINEAIKNTKLIILAAPATVHREFIESCLSYLRDGQIFITETGYFSCLRFKEIIKKSVKNILIAEMNLTPYTSSKEGDNNIFIHSYRDEIYIAALPAIETPNVINSIKNIYPGIVPAKNVLQTSFDNANWIMHAPFALPFRGLFERAKDYVLPIKDAIIPSAIKLTTAMENEKELLGKAYGLELPKFEHIFKSGKSWEEALENSPEFNTWKLKYKNGHNTYMTEDLYFALPIVSRLADVVKVPVPTVKSFLHLFSIIDNIDYMNLGLSLKDIGIDGFTVEEIIKFVEVG